MQTPYIEQHCTIEHNGRTFESGGAVVTDDYVIAYVGKTIPHGTGYPRALTDWHGNRIGECVLRHGWQIRSYMGNMMYQIYARIDGREYTGRGMGEGMICRLRPNKSNR